MLENMLEPPRWAQGGLSAQGLISTTAAFCTLSLQRSNVSSARPYLGILKRSQPAGVPLRFPVKNGFVKHDFCLAHNDPPTACGPYGSRAVGEAKVEAGIGTSATLLWASRTNSQAPAWLLSHLLARMISGTSFQTMHSFKHLTGIFFLQAITRRKLK